eukprot:TRINITY_DN5683_c0_g1_i1.p1 TRINITY_DN5683_c0_g1~~TRINITY_DN5683_c0_g1_i1.p1  ORF type:complete len:225 (-),score=54.15 TRINITY_DN5683_c0_g1_i1:47-721(-)
MGGKMKKAGVNHRAVATKERRQEAANSAKSSKEKAAEDAIWADNDKQAMKKEGQREAASSKAAAKQAAREEARAALAKEEAELAKLGKPKGASRGLTRAQIQAQAQKDREEKARKDAAADGSNGIVAEQPLGANRNREIAQARADGHVDASGIDSAVQDLSLSEGATEEDRNPERRRKALHKAYEAREFPRLKADNPGMKRQQLKQLCFKNWQKSPENPMNKKK